MVMRGKYNDLMVWFGIKCSSWVGINRGTSSRSACNPYGNFQYKSVADSNQMLERTDDHFDMHPHGHR